MTQIDQIAENALPQVSTPSAVPCVRRKEPDFVEACENPASGGVRLSLFAHERMQKRYGRRPLLSVLLDLPVCPECYSRMNAMQVIGDGLANGQWGAISKIAQQRNYGVLPIKENSTIEHVPFDDPEYLTLRRAQARKDGGE